MLIVDLSLIEMYFLTENGIYMFLWIGQAISPEWLQNVFGVQSTNQVDKQKVCKNSIY